jgi:hypothetical protein
MLNGEITHKFTSVSSLLRCCRTCPPREGLPSAGNLPSSKSFSTYSTFQGLCLAGTETCMMDKVIDVYEQA